MDLTGPGYTGNLKSESTDSLLSLLISFEKNRSEADPSAPLLIMSSFELSINSVTGCLQAAWFAHMLRSHCDARVHSFAFRMPCRFCAHYEFALHTCVSVLLLYNYFARKMIVRNKTEERASQYPKMWALLFPLSHFCFTIQLKRALFNFSTWIPDKGVRLDYAHFMSPRQIRQISLELRILVNSR